VQEVFDRLKASCEAHIAEATALQALASGRTSDSLLTPRRKMIEAFAREFCGFCGGSSPSRIFQPATPQQPPAGEREPPQAPGSCDTYVTLCFSCERLLRPLRCCSMKLHRAAPRHGCCCPHPASSGSTSWLRCTIQCCSRLAKACICQEKGPQLRRVRAARFQTSLVCRSRTAACRQTRWRATAVHDAVRAAGFCRPGARRPGKALRDRFKTPMPSLVHYMQLAACPSLPACLMHAAGQQEQRGEHTTINGTLGSSLAGCAWNGVMPKVHALSNRIAFRWWSTAHSCEGPGSAGLGHRCHCFLIQVPRNYDGNSHGLGTQLPTFWLQLGPQVRRDALLKICYFKQGLFYIYFNLSLFVAAQRYSTDAACPAGNAEAQPSLQRAATWPTGREL